MLGEAKCECAVAGVCGYERAAESCRDLLYQLQHRGQEWCGIASYDGEKIFIEKKAGYAEWAISNETLMQLPGYIAIGHNRYSTTGSSTYVNAQPHLVPTVPLSFCSNGDILPFCYQAQRAKLESAGLVFKSQNDGELLAKYLTFYLSRGDGIVEAIEQLMKEMVGAYSALLLYDGKIIAFRDPLGIRPLVMGRRDKTWLVASETCALDIVLAHNDVRPIAPGEVVILEPNKDPRNFHLVSKPCRHCVFELIYFSRPDSIVFNISAQRFRKTCGQLLASQQPVSAEVVIPVPDSSNAAALGYSRASHILFDIGLVRNHYVVGRTFIQPIQEYRDSGVRKTQNPVRGDDVIEGRVIVLVDDSLVRGTTSKKLISMLRTAGTKEIHLRIASPPIGSPCFYGIDMKTREELIATNQSIKEICSFVGADSLDYLTLENLREAVRRCQGNPDEFCYACFNGEYPTAIS